MPAPGPGPSTPQPRTPEEAAKQFEEVLARQFVQTMTKGLFKTGLSGEDGPGWMESYQGIQRDVMTDALTEHLVQSGTLRLSDLLMRQWSRTGAAGDPSTKEENKP